MDSAPVKILIIDDEPLIRELLQEYLPQLGYQAILAESGEKALKLTLNPDVKLAIVDLRLPGKDGLATIRELNGKYPELKFIIATAFSTPAAEKTARGLGVFAQISKPFKLAELQRLIAQALK